MTTKVKPHKVRATLRDRKRCYNGHTLTPETIDHYGRDGYRKSEHTQPGQVKWIGCRRCRADARMRWRVKNAEAIVKARNAASKAAKAALNAARPAAKPKAKPVARKVATVRSPSSKLGRKAKLTGQARIDAELRAFARGRAAARKAVA